jgi:RHS repeat-associated protein
VDLFNFWPFGDEMWDDSYSGETHKYTGHERDYEFGLAYMMARHYSWELHRFLSPDPACIGSGNVYIC